MVATVPEMPMLMGKRPSKGLLRGESSLMSLNCRSKIRLKVGDEGEWVRRTCEG